MSAPSSTVFPESSESTEPISLSLRDAAKLGECSYETMRKYVLRGEIPAVRTASGHFRLNSADVLAWKTPTPVVGTDADVLAWAERVAATAPVMTSEQVRLVADTLCGDIRRRSGDAA